jgi:hypothetical protein
MSQSKMNEYFNKCFGFLVLFVFVTGFISDLLINAGTRMKFPFGSPWFAQGLIPYYKSVGWIVGAILGGIACVFAAVIAQLLLKLKEDNE